MSQKLDYTKNAPQIYNSKRHRQFKSVDSEVNKKINRDEYLESKRRKLRNFNMNCRKRVK